MRAPSLYVYFDSKNALYDAMFADGNAELLRRVNSAVEDLEADRPPVAGILRLAAELFFDFCVEDPARYQLLFLRTIPGFEPSESSYALAREVMERSAAALAETGASTQEAVDLWTALTSGLVTQQLSNDPGGDRWRRLVDRAVAMYMAAELAPQR